MSGYDFLKSVTVIEVAQLGMDTLGQYLADMGARVIKVEALPHGDPVRHTGDHAIGPGAGIGFLHLRWNRGKESLGLNLGSPEGAGLFRKLAASADIVIEGLKGGALDRLGLGYETLRQANPALVYCALSGLGNDGPYHRLRSHAVAYDAFGGVVAKDVESPQPALGEFRPPSIGMHAPGLYAAVGVLSALHRAKVEGRGARIEVAAADAVANWTPDGVDAVVNAAVLRHREGFHDAEDRMMHWPRLAQYATRDGRTLLLEAFAWPTWGKFLKLVGREDLLALHEQGLDDYHARLRGEIAAIIATRSLDEWMADFLAHDISAMPVNDFDELARDPHYTARANRYDVDVPEVGTLSLSGTPIRVAGDSFSPTLAPAFGADTDRILEQIAGLDGGAIAGLRKQGVVA
jgi:crotonobetainyl-CoA:carnitine CoA-transferase CaiB-like acyl-CoA transferase